MLKVSPVRTTLGRLLSLAWSLSPDFVAKLKEIEGFVKRSLGDTHSLLTCDVQQAKSEPTKHRTEITHTPEGQTYRVSGDWDLLAHVRMVPGARIELATPAFSGRRSTNELPRHFF